MSNKGKKKLYDCFWYRYDYDDFAKYHICDCSGHIGCPFNGIVDRQNCKDFKKNSDVSVYLNVDKDFKKRCDKAKNTQTYRLEQIKDLCERQNDVLDGIIKIVEDMQKDVEK